MGLDRESDVVHIETRIAKGRECCTPVCHTQHPEDPPPLPPPSPRLERGHGEDETPSVVRIGPSSPVKQNRVSPDKTGEF